MQKSYHLTNEHSLTLFCLSLYKRLVLLYYVSAEVVCNLLFEVAITLFLWAATYGRLPWSRDEESWKAEPLVYNKVLLHRQGVEARYQLNSRTFISRSISWNAEYQLSLFFCCMLLKWRLNDYKVWSLLIKNMREENKQKEITEQWLVLSIKSIPFAQLNSVWNIWKQ